MSAEEHIQYIPESAAVDLRIVSWAAVAALVLLGGSIAGFYGIYQRAVSVKSEPPLQQFAQPRVVTSDVEVAERKRLADAQTQRLETWGWANGQHSLVQIPIDRAMQLLVQKGKDAWAPLLPPEPALASPTAGAERAMSPDASPNVSNTANPPKLESKP
jgi:hypothetical protein